tara:strand:+ start:563 stop:2554 length:1992 start_codon:yes stop_codon:yes gene_type:complete
LENQVTNINLRKDLNGLRFISVIAVILFHSKISLFNSGYIGVDIFFVLSGFFITQILINEKIKFGNINIINFLNKRFRRIFPALIITILFSSFVIYFFLYSIEYADVVKKSIIASATYFSNLYYYQYFGNYFVQSSDYLMLFHTWSLSIEIQFYIFFAIFYFIIFKINFFYRYLKQIIISLLLFSLFCTQMGANLKTQFPFIENGDNFYFFNQPWWASFYFPVSRLWEFLFGSLAAVYITNKQINSNNFFSLIGIICIFISFIIFNDSILHPSIFTILPVFGTYLIIIYNHDQKSFLNKIIASKIFNWGGLVSYSAYLVHYPIFVFFRITLPNYFENILILQIILVFIISHYSWKLIENPFRSVNKISNKKFIIFLIFSYFIITCTVLIYNKYDEKNILKYNEIYPNYDLTVSNQTDQRKEYFNNISKKVEFNKGSIMKSNKLFSSKDTKKILILGNSHAEDLFSIFDQNKNLFNNLEFRFFRTQLSMFLNEKINRDKIDFFINDQLFKDSDIIIISTNYRVYGKYSKDFDALQNLFKIIKNNNKKLVLTSNSPFFRNYRSPVIDIVHRHKNIKISEEKINSELFKLIDKHKLKFNKKIKKFAEDNNIIYLDKMDFICKKELKNCYSFTKYGKITIMDSYHYTLEGAKLFGEIIKKINWLKIN